MVWAIFYGNGSVFVGATRNDWRKAPASGVQAVVEYVPYDPLPDGHPFRPWLGVEDRRIWTGEDSYDPFGWGAKSGSLIDPAVYETIWRAAFYDPAVT